MKPSSIQWIFHRWLTLTVASLCLRERGGRFASKDRRSAANDIIMILSVLNIVKVVGCAGDAGL